MIERTLSEMMAAAFMGFDSVYVGKSGFTPALYPLDVSFLMTFSSELSSLVATWMSSTADVFELAEEGEPSKAGSSVSDPVASEASFPDEFSPRDTPWSPRSEFFLC